MKRQHWLSPPAPIFLYCLALAFGSALVLAAASIAFVMSTRPTFYFPFSTFEIARALEGAQVGRPEGMGETTVVSSPGFSTPPLHYEQTVRDALAQQLGVASDQVVFERVPTDTKAWNPAAEVAQEQYERALGPDAALYAGDPRFSALIFGPFRAAVRSPDGRWRVLSQTTQSVGPQWQMAVARLIGIALVLIFPVAWLFSRRLTDPIRAFAAAADRVGRGAGERVAINQGPKEIRVAAAALNDMQERLEQQMKTRTAVVAAIAHDLRTPLARLAFVMEDAPESIRTRTQAEIDRMDRMIAVSMDYVRSEAATPLQEKVHLDVLLEQVVDDFADRGALVTLYVGRPAVVVGEPVLLMRIFENLVSNALRYGGSARVSLRVVDDQALVSVEDEGPGLSEADLERAFEPFFRGEGSRNEATGGLGLGLTIAQSLARRHGGTVKLRNRATRGLAVEVTLPLAPT